MLPPSLFTYFKEIIKEVRGSDMCEWSVPKYVIGTQCVVFYEEVGFTFLAQAKIMISIIEKDELVAIDSHITRAYGWDGFRFRFQMVFDFLKRIGNYKWYGTSYLLFPPLPTIADEGIMYPVASKWWVPWRTRTFVAHLNCTQKVVDAETMTLVKESSTVTFVFFFGRKGRREDLLVII